MARRTDAGRLMLACHIVSSVSELEALAPVWSSLLARSDANEPTKSPLWMLAWWRVFGGADGRRLRVAMFSDGGRLVGLAPLCARFFWHRPGLPFRRLELIASGELEADEICSDYIGLVAEPGALDAVVDALVLALREGRLGGWDELVLPMMDGTSALPERLVAALAQSGISSACEPAGEAPYIPLPASWPDYLAKLSSSHRYVVQRSLRDFDKWADGASAFTVVATQGELEAGRRVLESLHQDRWSGESATGGAAGVFRSPRFAAFHQAVMPELLAAGALELACLAVRGEPVAAIYNIVWNNKVYFYQSGRRLDVPKGIRPGIVIHAHAIRRSIEAGRREYDFLNGASQYKVQLALATRPLVQVRAVRAPLRERLRLVAKEAHARLRQLSAFSSQLSASERKKPDTES